MTVDEFRAVVWHLAGVGAPFLFTLLFLAVFCAVLLVGLLVQTRARA